MPGINYLDLLEQGVDTWNRWRARHPDKYPDLESAYLFEQSLPGINLSNVNLSRACLIGANLAGADLTGANLQGVYANKINLQNANLTGALLQNGNLMDANLAQANLANAAIENTDFTNACLTNTGFTGWPRNDEPQQDSAVQTLEAPAAKPAAHSFAPLPKSLLAGVAIVMPFAIATTILYRLLSPKSTPLITDQGTISLPLLCNEPAVPPSPTGTPAHTYSNGTRFYGQFQNGEPADGRGTMIYSNGNRYDGEYQAGRRNGCGTFSFPTGRRYTGQFEQDLFSGRGMWILENGERYIGDFEFNRCNGQGIYIFANGTVESGIWQAGRLVNSSLTCELASNQSSTQQSILAYGKDIPNITPPADGGTFQGAPPPTPRIQRTPQKAVAQPPKSP